MPRFARERQAVRIGVACAVALAVSACARNPHPSILPAATTPAPFTTSTVIADVKDFAVSLGGDATGNFRRQSDRHTSDNRCYFTGKLQLPEYYSALRMVREDGERCAARSSQDDVFFYPVQAVASGDEVVTVSLAEAPTERLLVVVPHEDFHNQREARSAPVEVAEAAATLVGFITASEFARDRFGAESPTARMLARDAELFLRKSILVNQYYERVRDLYHDLDVGTITTSEALDRKAAVFGELQRSCAGIAPDPASFNKCPAAMNNAGLAFDRTYTRHYPMLHELYTLLGGDTAALVTTLKGLMANWPNTAASAAELIKRE